MKASLSCSCFAALLLFSPWLSANPAGDKVLQIFENKCASCHKDDEEPVLTAHTELGKLRSNDKFVIPGDAAGSPLFKLITMPADAKKRMPKSTVKKPAEPLSAEDTEAIRAWINNSEIAPRQFISETSVADVMLADLNDLQSRLGRKSNVRYLSLANLYNEQDAQGNPRRTDEDMASYRVGVNKLLNSISWNSKISLCKVIDPQGVLLRFDLADYGMAPELWRHLASGYPYQVQRPNSTVPQATKIVGDLPIMRADFFVFALAQPPFYHEALHLQGGNKKRHSEADLETKLGIVYSKGTHAAETVRAGFQKSGVSQGNRMIERIARPDGQYYWRSFDFDPRRQNDRGGNLFRAPLGPVEGSLTKNHDLIFSQDGGEIVFSLPNGLQGYMLTDGIGTRLDEAPLNVVTDKSRKDSRIINGISCMSCHKDGVFTTSVKDEVLKTSATLNLEAEDRQTIERLYNQERLDKYFAQDAKAFAAAQTKCGYTGGPEPVGMLYNSYINTLSIHQLGAELGLESPDLLPALAKSTNSEVQGIMAKFRGGAPVPRVDFESRFAALVAALEIGKFIPNSPILFTEYGGDINDPDRNKGITPGGPGGITPTKKPRFVVRIDSQPDGTPAPPASPLSTGGADPTKAPSSVPQGSGRKVVRPGASAQIAPAPATSHSPAEVASKEPAPNWSTASERKIVRFGPDGTPITTPPPAEAAPGTSVPLPNGAAVISAPGQRRVVRVGVENPPVPATAAPVPATPPTSPATPP